MELMSSSLNALDSHLSTRVTASAPVAPRRSKHWLAVALGVALGSLFSSAGPTLAKDNDPRSGPGGSCIDPNSTYVASPTSPGGFYCDCNAGYVGVSDPSRPGGSSCMPESPLPGNGPGPIGGGSPGGGGGGGGPADPQPENKCATCFANNASCDRKASAFEDLCEGYFAVKFAKKKCESGKTIDNKIVTPLQQVRVCVQDFVEQPDTGDSVGHPHGSPKPRQICHTEWRDPDNCVMGWLDGVAGESTTSSSTSVSGEFQGGSISSNSSSTTVSYNAQEGLIKACENAEFDYARECASTLAECLEDNECND